MHEEFSKDHRKRDCQNSALVELKGKGSQTRGACLFNQRLFSITSELFGRGETRITEMQCVVPVRQIGLYNRESYAVEGADNVIESSRGHGHSVIGRLSPNGTFALNDTLSGAESCVYRLAWDSTPFCVQKRNCRPQTGA